MKIRDIRARIRDRRISREISREASYLAEASPDPRKLLDIELRRIEAEVLPEGQKEFVHKELDNEIKALGAISRIRAGISKNAKRTAISTVPFLTVEFGGLAVLAVSATEVTANTHEKITKTEYAHLLNQHLLYHAGMDTMLWGGLVTGAAGITYYTTSRIRQHREENRKGRGNADELGEPDPHKRLEVAVKVGEIESAEHVTRKMTMARTRISNRYALIKDRLSAAFLPILGASIGAAVPFSGFKGFDEAYMYFVAGIATLGGAVFGRVRLRESRHYEALAREEKRLGFGPNETNP